MKIIDSGNGGFLQPSLFLKAFERVTDSQVCQIFTGFFFNFHRFHRFSFAEESLISLKKSRFVVGLFAENLLNFFPELTELTRNFDRLIRVQPIQAESR